MRSVAFCVFFFAASFSALDFNSRNRNFGVELLYHTNEDSDQDVSVAPYALWSLLVIMAYETTGVAREELSKVLLLTDDRKEVLKEFQKLNTTLHSNFPSVVMALRNALYYDEKFDVNPDSIRRLENYFGVIPEPLPFEFAPQMLALLESSRICGMLSVQDFADSPIIMCNSMMFQAKWLIEFKQEPFLVTYRKGNDVAYAFMRRMKARLRFTNFERLRFSVTELPYEDGRYCMLLLRPNSGQNVKQVLRGLREVSLKDVLTKLQRDAEEFGLRDVEVMMPSSLYSTVDLSKALFQMGLSDVLEGNVPIFNRLNEDNIYIGKVEQAVMILPGSSETVALSFTPGKFDIIYSKEVPVTDPFVYFIVEKSTATVLFGGSYTHPMRLDLSKMDLSSYIKLNRS